MLSASRPSQTGWSQLPSSVIGLVGGVLVVGVPWVAAVKIGFTAWEAIPPASQMVFFLIGSWLLSRDSSRPGAGTSWANIVGVMFSTVRFLRFAGVAFANPLPAQYAAIFEPTAFGWSVFFFYVAECILTQVLFHRLFSARTAILLGVVQALLFSQCNFRYMSDDDLSVWHVVRVLVTYQMGMFAPYYALLHPWTHKVLVSRPAPPAPVGKALPASSKSSSASLNTQGGLPMDMAQGSLGEPGPGTGQLTSADLAGATAKAPSVGAAAALSAGRSAAEGSVQGRSVASTMSAVRALKEAPYRSRLRTTHKVCIKLDTDMACSSLPPDMAARLQDALRASIGSATGLNVADAAVRPGCICISLKVVQEHTAEADANAHPTEFADALLPELQAMLSTAKGVAAVRHAVVQLGDSKVSCSWREDKQTWITDGAPAPCSTDVGAEAPWVGAAVASTMCAASSAAATSLTTPAEELAVVVDVQLWGISKVTDVSGWEPPSQHQQTAMGNKLENGRALQPPGSKSSLKLMARLAGGYLPTQVVRLVPQHVTGCVIAQVLVHVHEHQLVRHHMGGPPSTLLLMDLELWQNEALLSTSPILSLPSAPSAAADMIPALNTWWWGAPDRVVDAAVTQLQMCAQELMVSESEDGVVEACQAYVQFAQDVSLWLQQVQRTACNGRWCRLTGAAGSSETQLQQPVLEPSALHQLGQQLLDYTQAVGLDSVRQMLSQQMRSIRGASRQHANGSWLVSALDAVRLVMLGYPCQHDERLYKQRLASHLSGVLVVSSLATMFIGIIVATRSLGPSAFGCVAAVCWALHLAALVMLLMAYRSKPQKYRSVAFYLVMSGYVWRNALHLMMPVPTDFYVQAFKHDHVWPFLKLVLLLTDQLQAPASVVLPAPLMACVVLLLEFPAVLVSIRRGTGWGLAASGAASFLLVVVARIVLDTYFRQQLASPVSAAPVMSPLQPGVATRSKME